MVGYWFKKLADAIDEEAAAFGTVLQQDPNGSASYRAAILTLSAISRALRKVAA